MKTGDQPAFATIPGFSDRYMIYEDGRVYSNISGKFLALSVNKRNGYVYVSLHKETGELKGFRVHRLVACAFIPNPENLPEVDHDDYNKQNNHASNLKWCDRFYNNQHSAKKPGRKWQNHRLGKTGSLNPASKPVKVYGIDDSLIGIFESQALAATATGSNQAKISSCCLGKRKSHNHLKFSFA